MGWLWFLLAFFTPFFAAAFWLGVLWWVCRESDQLGADDDL
jgi:hypothetical protein